MENFEDPAIMAAETIAALMPVLETNRKAGLRKNRHRMAKKFLGGCLAGKNVAMSSKEYLVDPARSSAPRKVQGHVGYKVDGRKKRRCRGPVIARNQYRTHYAMPELGKHKWHLRKENALKNKDHAILWKSLHKKGKILQNPWHTKKKLHNQKGGMMYLPPVPRGGMLLHEGRPFDPYSTQNLTRRMI